MFNYFLYDFDLNFIIPNEFIVQLRMILKLNSAINGLQPSNLPNRSSPWSLLLEILGMRPAFTYKGMRTYPLVSKARASTCFVLAN